MTRLTEDAKGVYVIALTPFVENGDLDLASTDRMVDFYLERGATGLTVLGMMGEAQKLTIEELQTYVRRILKRVDGRVPVVAGVSGFWLCPDEGADRHGNERWRGRRHGCAADVAAQ